MSFWNLFLVWYIALIFPVAPLPPTERSKGMTRWQSYLMGHQLDYAVSKMEVNSYKEGEGGACHSFITRSWKNWKYIYRTELQRAHHLLWVDPVCICFIVRHEVKREGGESGLHESLPSFTDSLWFSLIIDFQSGQSHKYRERKQQVWMHNLRPRPYLHHLHLRCFRTSCQRTPSHCAHPSLSHPTPPSFLLAISLWRNPVAMSLSFGVAELALRDVCFQHAPPPPPPPRVACG